MVSCTWLLSTSWLAWMLERETVPSSPTDRSAVKDTDVFVPSWALSVTPEKLWTPSERVKRVEASSEAASVPPAPRSPRPDWPPSWGGSSCPSGGVAASPVPPSGRSGWLFCISSSPSSQVRMSSGTSWALESQLSRPSGISIMFPPGPPPIPPGAPPPKPPDWWPVYSWVTPSTVRV